MHPVGKSAFSGNERESAGKAQENSPTTRVCMRDAREIDAVAEVPRQNIQNISSVYTIQFSRKDRRFSIARDVYIRLYGVHTPLKSRSCTLTVST